ncbi:MAG TPA: hypothetical protein VGO11_08550, partial [Chthoniobacteraceae bacterium]|nr:hypothetical protein [Chthoniobacteraceae bacterium]
MNQGSRVPKSPHGRAPGRGAGFRPALWLALVLLGVTLTGCTKNGGAENFELEILVAGAAKDDASGAAMVDRVVRALALGTGDVNGWVPSKVALGGALYPNDRLEVDTKGMIGLMGSTVDAEHFTRKWDESRQSKTGAASIRAIGGPGPDGEDRKERVDAEDAFLKRVANNGVLIYDASLSPDATRARVVGQELPAFSDLSALRQEILLRVKKKKAEADTATPKIAVIVRSAGGDRPTDAALEILTPQIGESATSVPAETLANLQKIAAAGGAVKGLDVGLRRDDALDERLSVGGKGFWQSERVRGLLGRADHTKADRDGSVETMMGTLGEGSLVIGFTLPPVSTNQTEQGAEKVTRLFGIHSIDFYRDIGVVAGEVEKALKDKRKVGVILRYPPSRALERVIVREPVTLRDAPRLDAAPVRDASGRDVTAKWFEILYIWERKPGFDGKGQPLEFLYVADQEAPARSGEFGSRRKGWIPSTSAAPWKTQLVMRFTHPGGRKPCVFFSDAARLRSLTEAAEDARRQQAGDLFRALGGSPVRLPDGVTGVEPEFGVDWTEGLYVLPILSFEKQPQANALGFRPTIFQTVCLTRGGATAGSPGSPPPGAKSAAVDLDVVFVMDLTRSMEPFIKPTRDSLVRLTSGLLGKAGAEARRLRFGLWGYRDGFWDTRDQQSGQPLREARTRDIPGIGFVTKNFTTSLQDGATFLTTLAGVHQTEVDSIDYMEDVLAGVADAIQKTPWRPNAGRIVVLVGDAPGREIGQTDTLFVDTHPHYRGKEGTELPMGTRSGMNISTLRQQATENHVFIASIYLGDPKYSQYQKMGQDQFRALAVNPGGGTNFSAVDARTTADYTTVVNGFVAALGEQLFPQARTSVIGTAGPSADSAGVGGDMARGLFEAVVRDSRRAGCNLSVEGWAWDRDLLDSAQRPVEPCVLVSRAELNNLYETLKAHVFHMKNGKVGANDFL